MNTIENLAKVNLRRVEQHHTGVHRAERVGQINCVSTLGQTNSTLRSRDTTRGDVKFSQEITAEKKG